jgi:hypothetical protein
VFCTLSECDGLVCDGDHCLPSVAICDGVVDCEDISDEEESRCSNITSKGVDTFVMIC